MAIPSSSRGHAVSQFPSATFSQASSQLSQKSHDHIKKFVGDFINRGAKVQQLLQDQKPDLLANVEKYRGPLRNLFQKTLSKESTKVNESLQLFAPRMRRRSRHAAPRGREILDYHVGRIRAEPRGFDGRGILFNILWLLLETLRVVNYLSIENVLNISTHLSDKIKGETILKLYGSFEQFFLAEQRVCKNDDLRFQTLFVSFRFASGLSLILKNYKNTFTRVKYEQD
ncbi:hypothetical protein L596_029269 [Steinernema carpocapsae]|uniref:Uncharacterized protein n=1 Tax=Steinernema carpocapsae TaxID=34508 RepID=A0A4U5LU58_STECR|nr:hypothetical protein L596_029269 [Steinernema carpocapsae]